MIGLLMMSDGDGPEILALIPARGGSKTVPRKNIRLLAGKPLVAWAIETARASRRVTRVIVSTDDREMAAVALRFGAEVPFMRPAEFARDDTPDLPVFRHALEWLRDREGYESKLVIHLRPTTPNRRAATVDRAIDAFLTAGDIDSLRSVRPAWYSPYKMWRIGPDGLMQPLFPPDPGRPAYGLPRQALPTVYQGDGYVDVLRPTIILTSGTMLGTRIKPFLVEEPCIDIDDEEDLEEAERLFLRASPADLPASSA